MKRKIKTFIYNLIRPLFVSNVNPNEDYVCCNCCEPVLKRILFCSTKCYNDFENEPVPLGQFTTCMWCDKPLQKRFKRVPVCSQECYNRTDLT